MLTDIILTANWQGLSAGQFTQVDEKTSQELIERGLAKKIETEKPKKETTKIGK